MTGRRLVLLRHGRTEWNRERRAQGHADIGLDALGHEQAAAAAAHLTSSQHVSALWSSDLARARQTCGYLEDLTGLSATYDERLREFAVGQRQGLTMEEFAEAFPQAYAAWRQGLSTPGVPGSENAAAVAERIVPALRDALLSLGAGETGLVVTHGAALRVGLVGVLDWPAERGADLTVLGNCAWATIDLAESAARVRLAGYNQSVTALVRA